MISDNITLKEYFEKVLEERDKAIIAALAAAKEAVAVAERNSEQWRAGANEWRGAMTDRESRFMTIEDRASIEKEQTAFKEFMTAHSGTVTQINGLTADVKTLNTFKDNMAGKANQSSVTNVMIFSIIAAVGTAISLLLNLVNTLAK